MADLRWLAKLPRYELQQLRNIADLQQLHDAINRITETNNNADHTASTGVWTAGNASFEGDRSTLGSVTLQGSGRSTPQTNSVYSGRTIASETPTLHGSIADPYQQSFTPFEPTTAAVYHGYPSANVQNAPQPFSHYEKLCHAQDVDYPTGQATNQPLPQANEPTKHFFCVYCREGGEEKFINTKQDWKRHQEDFHPETGLKWECKVCSKVFYSGKSFKDHLKGHTGKRLPKECKKVVQDRRIYACGFEHCRELKDNWRSFCDHVSAHMKEGRRDWSYDKTIRNLLKHQTFATAWKAVYGDLGPERLTWDPKTTSKMRHALEYHQFGPSLDAFLRGVLEEGWSAPQPMAKFSPSQQPAASSNMLPNTSNMFEDWNGFPEYNFSPSKDIPILGSTEHSTSALPHGPSTYRNSYTMTDLPAFSEYDPPNVDRAEEDGVTHYFANPEYHTHESGPDHYNPTLMPAQENLPLSDPRKSQPNGLVNRSKNLFKKKSQHFQHPATLSHPDLPLNARMPRSPAKTPSSAYSFTPAAGLYMFSS